VPRLHEGARPAQHSPKGWGLPIMRVSNLHAHASCSAHGHAACILSTATHGSPRLGHQPGHACGETWHACGRLLQAGGAGRARACVAPQEGLRGADARVQHVAGQLAHRLPARHQVQQRALACAAPQPQCSREPAGSACVCALTAVLLPATRSSSVLLPARRRSRGAYAMTSHSWQMHGCDSRSHEPARSARLPLQRCSHS